MPPKAAPPERPGRTLVSYLHTAIRPYLLPGAAGYRAGEHRPLVYRAGIDNPASGPFICGLDAGARQGVEAPPKRARAAAPICLISESRAGLSSS